MVTHQWEALNEPVLRALGVEEKWEGKGKEARKVGGLLNKISAVVRSEIRACKRKPCPARGLLKSAQRKGSKNEQIGRPGGKHDHRATQLGTREGGERGKKRNIPNLNHHSKDAEKKLMDQST